MRYKFRGKRLDNGEWVYGFYLETQMSGVFILGSEIETKKRKDGITMRDKLWQHEVLPESVGQWTGLVDKNGKEIYEGDIVKATALLNDHHQRGATVVSPVEYWHGATCLSITYVPLSFDFQVSHEIEIIGNIHDNPELMGVE